MTTLPPAEDASAAVDRPPAEGRRTPSRWLAWVGLAVVVVLAGVAVVAVWDRPTNGSSATRIAPTQLVGHRLPDVTYQRFDGASAALSSLEGRPLVLNFWAATCVPCRTEMPALQRIHLQQGDRTTFLGIDTGDARSTGRDAARQSGVTYALASDHDTRLAGQLGVVALPTTVVVGTDGVVTQVHVGAVDPSTLERWIAQAR